MRELCLLQKISLSTIHLSAILAVAMTFVGMALAQALPATEGSHPQPEKSGPRSMPPTVGGDISSGSLATKTLESWTTPALQGSSLEPWDVLSGDVDTVDGIYTHEVTRVQWRSLDPIDLYIVRPVGVKNPPVILYLYSYPFETDRFLNHAFCKLLVKNGYAAVGFASALTGQRYHTPRPMKEWFVSQLPESLATSAHDVQMILNYLATRGDVDMNRVGMFGDGSGASIAILAAAVDSRIKTLDLLDPWGDWPEWIAKSTLIPENERPGLLKPEWLVGVAPLDPVKWLPELKTSTVRVQFVKNVAVTPPEAQQKIEAAAPPNTQIVHYEDVKAFRAAIAGGTGFDWIKAKMQFSVVPPYSVAGREQEKRSSTQTKDSSQ